MPASYPLSVKGRVTSVFGETGPSHKRPHSGVDIAAPTGTKVQSMQAGVVKKVNTDPSSVYGKFVVIDEGNGVLRQYSHLDKIAVAPGDPVGKGMPFALSGNTGKSTGPHLDVKKFVNGVPVDWAVEIGEVASGRRASGRAPAGGTGQWRQYVEKWAPEFGVPVNIAMSVLQHESHGNPRAKSPDGAIGLFQLMPGTARGLGVNPYDPLENIRGGLKYLAQNYKQFGNWEEALAGYNAGPGAVRSGKWHKFAETRNYVKNVLATAGGAAPVGPGQSDPLPPATPQDAMKQMAALMPEPPEPMNWADPFSVLGEPSAEPQAMAQGSTTQQQIDQMVQGGLPAPAEPEPPALDQINWADPWSVFNASI